MIVLPNGEIVTDDEKEYEGMPYFMNKEDEGSCEEVPLNRFVGLELVGRRALTSQVKEEEIQCENIFYAWCPLNGKVCSFIVDNGSCANMVSALMVEKLKLTIRDHPRPYKLQ